MDVAGDVYPYNAGSTKLDNMMPAWAHDGGIAKLLERLADRATRRRIVEECLIDGERWGTVSQGGIGFDQVFIATCRAARARRAEPGPDRPPVRDGAGRDPDGSPARAERARSGMVSFSQSIENVAKVLAHPALMIGSDSIPLYSGDGDRPGKPHPRTYGTFPRVLGEYAREQRLFPLETAVHKMTGMCAARLRLRGPRARARGLRRRPHDLRSRRRQGRVDLRRSPPLSDRHSLRVVNGAVVVDGGRMSPLGPGRVLTP